MLLAETNNLTKSIQAPPLPPTRANSLAYFRWAQRVGPAPFVAALSHASGRRPLSTLLYQRASCPLSAQGARFFHCPLRRIDRARLGDAVDLISGDAAAKGRSALLLQMAGTPQTEREDQNIYHVLSFGAGAGSVWCVWEAVQDLRRAGVPGLQLVAERRVFSAMSPWKRELLALLLPLWSPPDKPTAHSQRRVMHFRQIFTFEALGSHGTEPRKFEIDRAPEARARLMAKAIVAQVRRSAYAAAAETARNLGSSGRPHVLLLQRATSRILVGWRGRPAELLEAMCDASLPVRLLSFDALSLREQVLHVSHASVLVGVHGAHLVNLIFLQDSAAVVEVLMRSGWCCDLTRRGKVDANGSWQPGCACVGYHKADYANLAHAHGLTYRYVDASHMSRPQHNSNPIQRRFVYVDSLALARVVSALHTEALAQGGYPPARV